MVAFIRNKFGKEEFMSDIETISKRSVDRVLSSDSNIYVKNIAFGINVYKNTISKDDCFNFIDTLNTKLSGGGLYKWNTEDEFQDVEELHKIRSVFDFQMNQETLGPKNKDNIDLHKINDLVLLAVKKCVSDYASLWDISINHYEPLNFVKYEYPNSYFKRHIDHSPNIVRTVSAVVYLNDDYEGGELRFLRLDELAIKPEAGDILVFPSTYLYEHESKNVTKGAKYSVAAFTDYSERNLKNE
jgi:hypothetical protein